MAMKVKIAYKNKSWIQMNMSMDMVEITVGIFFLSLSLGNRTEAGNMHTNTLLGCVCSGMAGGHGGNEWEKASVW